MIDDDRVDAARTHHLEALVIAGAAVAGDEERGRGGEDARQRRRREAVAALPAGGEEGHHLAAEGAEDAREDGRRGDAVAVVVAEDADPLPGAHRAGEALGARVPVGHGVGRREVGQARIEVAAGGVVRRAPAPVEHVRGGDGEAQRAGELERGGGGPARIARALDDRRRGRARGDGGYGRPGRGGDVEARVRAVAPSPRHHHGPGGTRTAGERRDGSRGSAPDALPPQTSSRLNRLSWIRFASG